MVVVFRPDDEEERTKYDNNLAKYNELADAKKIDNNATIALKEIITDRAGHDEAQRIQLKYEATDRVCACSR